MDTFVPIRNIVTLALIFSFVYAFFSITYDLSLLYYPVRNRHSIEFYPTDFEKDCLTWWCFVLLAFIWHKMEENGLKWLKYCCFPIWLVWILIAVLVLFYFDFVIILVVYPFWYCLCTSYELHVNGKDRKKKNDDNDANDERPNENHKKCICDGFVYVSSIWVGISRFIIAMSAMLFTFYWACRW